jgi:hypothetical protein
VHRLYTFQCPLGAVKGAETLHRSPPSPRVQSWLEVLRRSMPTKSMLAPSQAGIICVFKEQGMMPQRHGRPLHPIQSHPPRRIINPQPNPSGR